jgi:hypothetical protein
LPDALGDEHTGPKGSGQGRFKSAVETSASASAMRSRPCWMWASIRVAFAEHGSREQLLGVLALVRRAAEARLPRHEEGDRSEHPDHDEPGRGAEQQPAQRVEGAERRDA